MSAPLDPQAAAADPGRSSWASANAGSGKTSTLVARVARLLLAGSEPERILCLTYTRAAAAEMQRRLFDQLGSWAVMDDAALAGELAAIGEEGRDLSSARRLFARALESPGGLKIGTIHAFCQGLLSRFPLEAGVAPGFTVLDEGEARALSVRTRGLMAEAAMARPDHPLAKAYAHFAVALSFDEFETLLKDLSFRRRRQIAGLLEREGTLGPWKRCGFDGPVDPEALEKEAVQRTRWRRWGRAVESLETSNNSTDQNLAATMKAAAAESSFESLKAVFFTRGGEIRKQLATRSSAPEIRGWLADEQARVSETVEQIKAARCAEETSHAFVIATAWSELYEGAKAERRALDYDDLIERARDLLTRKADAAWVLYKLDGGIDHLLLDEAQDTSPEQWEVITALTAGFFVDAGAGARERTIFAVGDEKQSIFAFQGARPERFAIERAGFEARASAAGRGFASVPLLASYRSAPEILRFVDEVFTDPVAARGLRPQGKTLAGLEIRHKPVRRTPGSVELWPEEKDDARVEFDPWEGTEVEITSGKRVKLARRIAAEIIARVKRREAVFEALGDGGEIERPCEWRDFLILVRSRGPLYEEIIRALKLKGAPVGGADRMILAEHGLVIDLMALAWFVLHPADDLSLAAVLRGP
ncbi:MAG: UvrD-helicase domain-containing protein, partial [Caulobacteraceae bacterium]